MSTISLLCSCKSKLSCRPELELILLLPQVSDRIVNREGEEEREREFENERKRKDEKGR